MKTVLMVGVGAKIEGNVVHDDDAEMERVEELEEAGCLVQSQSRVKRMKGTENNGAVVVSSGSHYPVEKDVDDDGVVTGDDTVPTKCL